MDKSRLRDINTQPSLSICYTSERNRELVNKSESRETSGTSVERMDVSAEFNRIIAEMRPKEIIHTVEAMLFELLVDKADLPTSAVLDELGFHSPPEPATGLSGEYGGFNPPHFGQTDPLTFKLYDPHAMQSVYSQGKGPEPGCRRVEHSVNMAAIGVHFGYTCACVAIYKDGRADVVANDAGDRVTPAVVGYRDTEQIVGIAAKQGQIRNAANTVVKVKQVLGRSFDDPETQTHKTDTKCQVVNKNEKPFYEITAGEHPKYVAPEDVAKLIFHKMKETAQSALGSDATEAVITVPFEFAQAQKRALRDAAEAAGFHVLRLIHEPAAALLAYNIGQDCPSGKSHVLVYKLGGTSLSVTVLQVNGGMFRVLNTHTDHSIGGESFTQALAQHLASEFKRSFKHDVSSNTRAMMKLMNGADMAKHSLSSLGSANCFVDSLHDGIDFECNVSRARFELLCSSLFNKSIQPIRPLLEKAGLSTSNINKVVLCGGSARIPRLQQMIQDLFPDVELLSSAPPDEVIAVGAALQAGLLVGRESLAPEEESVTVDVSATDILLKEVNESGAEVFTVLLPSGTPLPARRNHILSGGGKLSSLSLDIYQRCLSEQPEKLAKIILRDLQPREENHDIDTVVTMKRDGSVHVSCTEQSTGRSEVITIAASS